MRLTLLHVGVLAVTALMSGCRGSGESGDGGGGGGGSSSGASGLMIELKAAPSTIYVNRQPGGAADSAQPQQVKLTLNVTNPNAMIYEGEARNGQVVRFTIKRESNGQELYSTPAPSTTMITPVKIGKGESKTYAETATLQDVRALQLETLIATGTFTPTGESDEVTIQVRIAQ